jgi:hypothetical protein
MRAPARFVLLMDFAVAFLASIGVHGLLRASRDASVPAAWRGYAAAVAVCVALALLGVGHVLRLDARGLRPADAATVWAALAPAVVVLAVVSALIGLYARSRLSARAMAVSLAALSFAELLASGSSMDWADGDPVANLDPPALSFLRDDPGRFRTEVRPEAWGAWAPGATLVHGLDDVGGVYNPLQLADYQLYWESLTDRETRLYDFLNAKYVVGPKDFALPWDRFVPVHDADPSVNIYLNLASMPRALAVTEAVRARSHDEAWTAIHAPGFDPEREVVVESPSGPAGTPSPTSSGAATAVDTTPTSATAHTSSAGPLSAAASPSAVAPTSAARPPSDGAAPSSLAVADITAHTAHAIDVDVQLPAAGFLVLSESHYPGWQATVDGHPAPIMRANYAFRAVPLPSGAHIVRLRFRPIVQVAGLVVTLLSVAACAAIAWRCRARRRGD